jgi:protocatechuate 3,4-dioxygenase beta subunit
MTKRSLILGVLLTSIALRAQDFASIRGLVTDSAGAAVTGAKVQVTEEKRGLSYSTATNETGEYELRGLLPGTYRLIVEGPSGFKKFESAGVVVYARELRRVDVPL